MIQYRADWIVPVVEPPIRDGWVAVDHGRIVALGRERVPPPAGRPRVVREFDLGRVALVPALVNAHTHLELSWMRGRLGQADSLPEWIGRLIALRRSAGGANADVEARALQQAITDARRTGTALVGDVGNTLMSVGPLAANGMCGVVFRELIGFNPEDADEIVRLACAEGDRASAGADVRTSLAAHAPYSVAPLLFRAIGRALGVRPFLPGSVHLAESREEIEFLKTGSGPWRALLERLGVWNPAWQPPGCGPVGYLEQMGFLSDRLLVVHGVHLAASELARLARAGATLVTCPRGNQLTGAGAPPVGEFHRSGIRVALGTDSLASVGDLNLFMELAAVRRLDAGIPACSLLEWATVNGARALGFDREFGAIEPGCRAALLALDLPPRVADVEEYLLSGITPDQIRWVEASS